ncbi:hypothetical protein [Modicisalibacter sp. MOD 31.J]|uniref:hypothetical protein n=1 Tax=Modicisalibacter sp. MOD 31.J TaxID=2831897 RepID=UPI001CD000D0|nr:hypothetical protein [Modicisalibacter sp. MOD 31.J]MBZ9574562.1 hypothetical protein [Modicisalibacter sp. MOD 31.J]
MTKLTGWQLIANERKRQIKEEGWSLSHDDQHGAGVLASAALCYRDASGPDSVMPHNWPWDATWWKPKSRERNLERAGALYQAAAEVAERAQEYRVRDDLREHVASCANLLDSILEIEAN